MQKKSVSKSKKLSENREIHVEERGATRILFYSICAVVPLLSPGSDSNKTSIPFHFDVSG